MLDLGGQAGRDEGREATQHRRGDRARDAPLNPRLEEAMEKASQVQLVAVWEDERTVWYCEFEGKRIARRCVGERWVSLEPGFTVRGQEPGNYHDKLTVEYRPAEAE